MGTDDIFAKKKAERKARKHDTRTPRVNSFLIVTEGEKTEPLYFEGLSKYIEQKYGSSPDISKPTLEICGKGMCTTSLVIAAAEIRKSAPIMYENAWVVLDKDDFTDFDDAIELAEKTGLKVAWSNQSFEYWLYLHFEYCDAALHRDTWVDKLSDIFKQRGINPNGYKKNDEKVFEVCVTNGSLKAAVGNAKRRETTYSKSGLPPSKRDPSTTVHKLVLELKPYIEELFE